MLPDGRIIIDAKNTVQSLTATTSSGTTPSVIRTTPDGSMTTTDSTTVSNDTPPSNFTLPDGRIIDAKNTLQSFALSSISERQSRKDGTPNLVSTTLTNSHRNNTANVEEGTVRCRRNRLWNDPRRWWSMRKLPIHDFIIYHHHLLLRSTVPCFGY
jgi:hypothetical protein